MQSFVLLCFVVVISSSAETEKSSGWQLWYSLEMLKLVFNVSSEYQGCHNDELFHLVCDGPSASEVTLSDMGSISWLIN